MMHLWAPLCVICCRVLTVANAQPAVTLYGGDAVCGEHLNHRALCATLDRAITLAREDLIRSEQGDQ